MSLSWQSLCIVGLVCVYIHLSAAVKMLDSNDLMAQSSDGNGLMIDIRATKRALKKKKGVSSQAKDVDSNNDNNDATVTNDKLQVATDMNTSKAKTAAEKSAGAGSSTSLATASKATSITTTSTSSPPVQRSKKLTFTPNFKDQVQEEKRPYALKFHKCRDGGEAYSAAYLCHKEHLLEQFTDYNLTWVNCEMGSFIMMNGRAQPKFDRNGSITMSLDVLDYSVLHLSAYERLQRRWASSIKTVKIQVGDISPIQRSVNILKTVALAEHQRRLAGMPTTTPQLTTRLNRTVAIMPFLGSDMGAGHSKLGNRFVYLQACFWSIYEYMPHIVAVVKSKKDAGFAKETSGLPFFDVILLENLPKSASLPVATVQQTKARLQDGRWTSMFDYVYFTESDQILMMRIGKELYDYINLHKRRMLLPHRLMPYPEQILTHHHHRQLSPTTIQPERGSYTATGVHAWHNMSCCLRRQNCWDRKEWTSVKDSNISVVNIAGILTPLGNSNFHAEQYRGCTLYTQGVEVCP